MAMKRLIAAILGIAFMLPPSLAHARWNDSDAKYACKQAATNEYGARHFHGLVVNRKGSRTFKVTGVAERRGRSDVVFKCKIKHGQVTSLERQNSSSGSSSLSTGQAVGVIAGAVIGAAIIGAISKDHKNDHHHSSGSGGNHGGNWGKSYKPKKNVTCYRGQRACYKQNGSYSAKWTRREFK